MKICVYTCITGNYDNIKEIDKKNFKEDIDFICYTNNKKMKSNTWRVIYIEDKTLTNVQLARKIKILGTEELKKYDVTLWMDGDIEWNTSITKFINKFVDLNKYDLIGFKHSDRNTIFEEIIACLELGKTSFDNAKKVYEYYKNNDFKDDRGLIESTLLFRDFKNKKIQVAMKKWFDFILKLSHRDQLSFNYVEYLTDLNVNLLNIKIWNNDYFRYYKHSKITTAYAYYQVGKYYDLSVGNSYTITPNQNKIIIIPSYNTESVKIKFDSEYSLIVSDIKCNKTCDINDNCYEFDKKRYCCSWPLVIELKGFFKKNDRIELSFNIELYDSFEVLDILHKLEEKNAQLINEKQKIIDDTNQKLEMIGQEKKELEKYYREELNNILNSRSWKITKPLRALSSKTISRKKE